MSTKEKNAVATMTIEYNEQNKYVKQVLDGLIGSGLIRRRYTGIKNNKISHFKTALQECKNIATDIAQNGTDGYKTLDDLLNED